MGIHLNSVPFLFLVTSQEQHLYCTEDKYELEGFFTFFKVVFIQYFPFSRSFVLSVLSFHSSTNNLQFFSKPGLVFRAYFYCFFVAKICLDFLKAFFVELMPFHVLAPKTDTHFCDFIHTPNWYRPDSGRGLNVTVLNIFLFGSLALIGFIMTIR